MDAVRLDDETQGYYIDEHSVGMTAVHTKTLTETDIVLFAGISGDSNPLHLNQEYASETMFEGRIAHGMLTASFISTVLGTKLPGPGCIRSEEHTSELQSLMRISYAVFCLKKKKNKTQ